MKATKEHGKCDGHKPQRKTNGDDLRRALNWIVIDGIFADVRLHGNVKWKPLALVCLAIIWVWSSQPGLVEAAKEAIATVAKLFGSDFVAITSYQALTTALVRYTPQLLPPLWAAPREFDATVRPSRLASGKVAAAGRRRFPSQRAADRAK